MLILQLGDVYIKTKVDINRLKVFRLLLQDKWHYHSQSVVLVDEIDDYFDHRIFLLGAAFGYHQSKSDKCIISDTLCAIFIVEYAISV